MRKILFVITKSNWGGAQRYVYDLATSLPSSQFSVAVACGRTDDQNGLDARLKSAGIEVIYVDALARDVNASKDLTVFKELHRIFKKNKPDIVHLNSSKAGGLGAFAARLAGVHNIIFTAHGWPFYEDRPLWQRTIIKFLSWMTVALSHTTIALCERDLHAFDGWPFTSGKITKIYNGILAAPTGRASAQSALESHGIHTSLPLIGTIAELHKNKGLSYLIEAMVYLPGAALCIIGDGEERAALEDMINANHLTDRVFLPGFIADAANLIAPAFDIFVLPSIKEGFPYVILEAGAVGLPTVASCTGGILEIIDNNESGLLVQPKDVSGLVRALHALIDDTRKRTMFGKALQEKIIREFSLKQMADRTIEVYSKR
ncbi:MAG TPA: glycosyltransferase family 4 protein [Candidatus Paceibacterota bacterium]